MNLFLKVFYSFPFGSDHIGANYVRVGISI